MACSLGRSIGEDTLAGLVQRNRAAGVLAEWRDLRLALHSGAEAAVLQDMSPGSTLTAVVECVVYEYGLIFNFNDT